MVDGLPQNAATLPQPRAARRGRPLDSRSGRRLNALVLFSTRRMEPVLMPAQQATSISAEAVRS